MQKVNIGGASFKVEVLRRHTQAPDAPRLITVCFNTAQSGVEVTRVCIESILRHTPDPYELWVVDNASPPEYSAWLRELEGVNVILNHTPPVPEKNKGWRTRLGLRKVRRKEQMSAGSYANAIGLELGAWAIDPATEQVFVMHNDILALHDNWLPYLQAQLSERVRMAAIRQDQHPKRINALHVSGMLFDFQLFRQLQITFMPDPPRIDVGDRISEVFRAEGYGEFVCRNTHAEAELVAWLADDDPLAELEYTMRGFDDQRRAIFAHLGRGTPKATGTYWKNGRTMPEAWVAYAEEVVLS